MNRTTKLNELRRDKNDVLKLKKLSVKNADSFETKVVLSKVDAEKGKLKEDTEDVIYRKIIANTYYWKDSHDDVHVKGTFTKSIKENVPFFLHDHKFETTAKLGEVLASYEKELFWRDLGLPVDGKTISLIHDVAIEKERNAALFKDYKENRINQHSVGMQYVKIDLALDDESDKEAYALYQKYLPLIGNSSEVEKQGYFFAVSEAKLRETSAVLLGSNPITGILDNNNKSITEFEAQIKSIAEKIENKEIVYNICKSIIDTYKIEPSDDTQGSEPSDFETERKNLLLNLLKS